jgi:CPA2 family monovalent cation:H+ antiporter-2
MAIGFVLAFSFGYVADRLRLPPLVGYLVAGILIGPYTPGFVGDAALSSQLAEVGVILLMFGVGPHFSASDLLAVRGVAIPGGQIVLATLLGMGMCWLWGWSLGTGLVVGLSLSVASTVVLLKALEERNLVDRLRGRVAVGCTTIHRVTQALARRHRDDARGQGGGRGAGHCDPRPPGDRPQGVRELQELGLL